MAHKRKTKGRQRALQSGVLPGFISQFFRKASAPAEQDTNSFRSLSEEKALFPNVSRTIPEQMGVFPEQVPKNTRRNVLNSR
ncbi:MAG: hypothetical protein B7X86_09470 [Sphingobacteriales bacterium 17-39-43]|nr:MAG: hypothetical protein B7Y76_00815 [Sphingobacteriia bacterium 35-40-5]OYZ31361.1 MAG: hypothetical protein B7Y24_09265 [Sphingobacteriales bacterium 16-39-50]OZA24301.1 MAG: hypothetical protein B7X86_09470 [Sphingobacteriales bacterium 17-39-43]